MHNYFLLELRRLRSPLIQSNCEKRLQLLVFLSLYSNVISQDLSRGKSKSQFTVLRSRAAALEIKCFDEVQPVGDCDSYGNSEYEDINLIIYNRDDSNAQIVERYGKGINLYGLTNTPFRFPPSSSYTIYVLLILLIN